MNTVYFFGIKKEYGFMSNFYPCQFTIDGQQYNCSEQYFMKQKQEYFDPTNIELANKIMLETGPKKIKLYGRQVKNYDEKKWNLVRYGIMKRGLWYKFQQPELKEKILATGNKILAEASPFDKIWGIGITKENAVKINSKDWPGQNLLGKALMEVRDDLRKM
jgi:ribA/ribD-fused uncharacterized protein